MGSLKAINTHVEGKNESVIVDGEKRNEKFLQAYFRDEQTGIGPLLFLVQDKTVEELTPSQLVNVHPAFSYPNCMLEMRGDFREMVDQQHHFHALVRSGADKTKLKSELSKLEDMVKDINPKNAVEDKGGVAKVYLRRKSGFKFVPGRIDEVLPILENVVSYDIETVKWWTPEWSTDLVAVSKKRQGEIRDLLLGSYPGKFKLKSAQYWACPDEKKLREITAGLLRGACVTVNQNGHNYDATKLMRRRYDQATGKYSGDGLFKVTCDNSQYRFIPGGPTEQSDEWSSKWGVKLVRRDGFDMDLMVVSGNYFNGFLPDKKMETLDRFFRIMQGIDLMVNVPSVVVEESFEKTMNYTQLDAAVKRYEDAIAEGRHDEGAEVILPRLLYAEEDTRVPLELYQKLLPNLRKIAEVAGVSYQSVFNDTLSNIALRWWERQRHRLFGTIEEYDQSNFAIPGGRRKKLEYGPLQERMLQHALKKKKHKTKKGMIRGVQIMHKCIFGEALVPVLKRYDDFRRLHNHYEAARTAIQREMFAKALAEWCREPVWDIVRKKYDARHGEVDQAGPVKFDGRKRNRIDMFQVKYGVEAEGLEARLDERVDKTVEELSKMGIVNSLGNCHFVIEPDRLGDNNHRREKGYRSFGKADLISLGPGKAVYKLGGMIMSKGVKLPGFKVRKLDEKVIVTKPNVHTRVTYDFVDACFKSVEDAIDLVDREARRLRNGHYETERYVWKIAVHEDVKYRGLDSQENERNKIIKSLGGKKGETLFALVVEDNKGERQVLGLDYERKEYYWYKKFSRKREYCSVEKDGKRDVFVSGERSYRVCYDHYVEWITGFRETISKEGNTTRRYSTVFRIMQALFPRKQEREYLEMLGMGEANSAEVYMLKDRLKEMRQEGKEHTGTNEKKQLDMFQ